MVGPNFVQAAQREELRKLILKSWAGEEGFVLDDSDDDEENEPEIFIDDTFSG